MVILIKKIKGYLTIVILSCVLMHFLEQEKGLGHTPRDHSLVVCHVSQQADLQDSFQLHHLMSYKAQRKDCS